MKAKLIDHVVLNNGRQRLTFETGDDLQQQYADLKDGDVRIEITKYRNRRSLDANAYLWVLIDKLAFVLNRTKEEIYKEAIRDIGGVSEIVCVKDEAVDRLCEGWRRNGIGWQTDTMPSKLDGCTNVILYYGSSSYDTKQMSNLIDTLVEDCKQLGIETMTPDQIAALEAAWK